MPFTYAHKGELVDLPTADECVGCLRPVELGRDYCPGCAASVTAAVARGECHFCKSRLSDYLLAEGVCACGKPLNNAPPLANVGIPDRVRDMLA